MNPDEKAFAEQIIEESRESPKTIESRIDTLLWLIESKAIRQESHLKTKYLGWINDYMQEYKGHNYDEFKRRLERVK